MQPNDRSSPAAAPEVAYSVLIRWWWTAAVVLVVGLALAFAGILSGNGILGVPYTLCGFLAGAGALAAMTLMIWRGFIEGNQLRSPRRTREERR